MTTPRPLLAFALFTLALFPSAVRARFASTAHDPSYDNRSAYDSHYDEHHFYDDEPWFDREFSLGVGYSRIEYSDPADELDAVHFNGALSFAPLEGLRPLRLGAALGWSFSVEDVGGTVISSGGGSVNVAGDTSLMLFQPELTVGWRQPLGDEEVGLFVEPGIAGGGTLGFYDFDDEAFEAAGGDGDPDEWAATWHARAYLRAGLRVSGGIAGLEAHYLRGGHLDFDNDEDGDLETVYVGLFGALKF